MIGSKYLTSTLHDIIKSNTKRILELEKKYKALELKVKELTTNEDERSEQEEYAQDEINEAKLLSILEARGPVKFDDLLKELNVDSTKLQSLIHSIGYHINNYDYPEVYVGQWY